MPNKDTLTNAELARQVIAQREDEAEDRRKSERRNTPPRAEDSPRKVRFNPEINLGHVITCCTLLGAMAVQWNLLVERQTKVEMAIAYQRERDDSQDRLNAAKFERLDGNVSDVKRAVEKIADKVGAK